MSPDLIPGLSEDGQNNCPVLGDSRNRDISFVERQIDDQDWVVFAIYNTAVDDLSVRIREAFALDPCCEYVLRRLGQSDEFLDVGANIGLFSLPVARKGFRTLAVEALAMNYTLLVAAARRNALKNFVPVHAAAWNAGGIVGMRGIGPWGTVGENGKDVPACELDDLLDLHGFANVKLIKLDIEGSELFALEGLRRTMASNPEVELIVEVNEPACRRAGYTGTELLQKLERFGFRLFGMFGRQLVEQTASDLRLLYCMDFLAIRSSSFTPPPGFFVGRLEYKDSISLVLSQLESPFMVCRRYMAEALSSAPLIVADDAVQQALDRLVCDPEKLVRRSIAWWKEDRQKSGKLPIISEELVRERSGDCKQDSIRLAIAGSESSFCGIASYIRYLNKNLEASFDLIDVPLRQRIMRDRSPAGRRAAFEEVSLAGALLKQADWVNLHFEPGTLGTVPRDIVDRFETLIENAGRLIVTFHSVGRPEASAALARLGRSLGGRVGRFLINEAYQHLELNFVWRKCFETLKRSQRKRRVAFIAHTKADAHLLRTSGFREVYDHPLCYLSRSELEGLKSLSSLRSKMTDGSSRVIKLGLFGFISFYKGVLTAVEALRHLPSNFRLIIYGSIHPVVGLDHQECDAHLRKILQRIEQEQLAGRIDFRESPDDAGFFQAMQAVDIVLCPYMEMRQSASGPAKMAIELGKPLVCTRTESFLELATYYPNRIRLIDIGNFLQLAQTVQAIAEELAPSSLNGKLAPLEPLRYTAETLRDLYCKIMLA